MTGLIIGFGEVGRAHFENLKEVYSGDLFYKDKGPEIYNSKGEVVESCPRNAILMIATQCDPNNIEPFVDMVVGYYTKYSPFIIDILTTCPVNTCEAIAEHTHIDIVCRSSTRGMHPNLAKFLIDIPKHIGGPQAEILKEYYEAAGWTCYTHEKARTVELQHIMNNIIYGANIMIWDEICKIARHYAVDIHELIKYRETNNSGFIKAGYPSKVSPILYPLNNAPLGGHCIVYSATCIPDSIKGPIMGLLATFNKGKGSIKSNVN